METQRCYICEQILPIAEFNKRNGKEYQKECRICHHGVRFTGSSQIPQWLKNLLHTHQLAWCTRCEQVLAIEDFGKSVRTKWGHHSHCRQCHNLDVKRKYHTYLTEEDLKLHAAKTYGKCDSCGKTTDLCIDHCHVTNTYRGHLCDGCNRGLGMIGDSLESLQAMVTYLQKHRSLQNG